MSQTPAQVIRDMQARAAAIRQYAAAHDRFAEYEQEKVLEGADADAQGAAIYAAWCMRACRAELDDPPFKAFGTPS